MNLPTAQEKDILPMNTRTEGNPQQPGQRGHPANVLEILALAFTNVLLVVGIICHIAGYYAGFEYNLNRAAPLPIPPPGLLIIWGLSTPVCCFSGILAFAFGLCYLGSSRWHIAFSFFGTAAISGLLLLDSLRWFMIVIDGIGGG